ncbi:ATPase component of ABC transporters with duplicated ATPase domain [Fervidobacterium pennivorans DSM 9078]|uniref:ATPase component of ABC transporters with duplicated ATPase domain n=1 Tax=Fervidobacterium pennivorans (strain DSM 9078 / Ven5) TaxID=771875 RepID=H9UBB9_FERPD|nr:ABC-F family ATP-binding cassette domain-containing protein [Fervidobacterium pennivorans]AFG34812.1 ATPase component of ABC transporters with duplicated ATPase domain [Fervidobacterium pennivorans DSM 9078]
MINIKNLTIEFPEKVLFKNFSALVTKDDKIGLMGKNGSGKTTLIKALVGKFKDYSGEINVSGKIVLLDQFREFTEKTPIDYYLSVSKTPEQERLSRSILKGFGFEEKDWTRDINTFSGGEKTKLQIGRLFLEEPDFLLLDEPTNFLDLKSINFLKNLLKNSKIGYIIISHDRDFLRATCNKFWDINNETIWVFNTNFDNYLIERKRIIETQERQYKNMAKEIERLKKIIDQYRKWGREKLIKQAKSKEKVLEKMMEELESMPVKYLEEDEKYIEIPQPEKTGYIVLKVENLSYPPLLKDVTFTVFEKDKIGIVGPNGSGKTTLLKIILGLIKASGKLEFGYNVKPAFVDQFIEKLDPESTVFDEIFEEMPDKPDYVIRAYAGRFGFIHEDVFKPISTLSGGERQILALSKVLLQKPNVLILDEPTNHMDLQTVEALEKALKEYQGSVILVSHDLELLKNTCNRFLVIDNKQLFEVRDFEELTLRIYDILNEKTVQKQQKVQTDFEEKKRIKNTLKNLRTKLEGLENEEKSLSIKIEEINKNMHSVSDYQKVMDLFKEKEELEEKALEILEEIENTKEKILELEKSLEE